MLLFSKELLIQPYPQNTVIDEIKSSGSYSLYIKCSGVYEIEIVGGGGGGVSNAADGNYGIPSAGGAGGAGAYYKGLFRLNGNTTLSGSIGGGGGANVTNVYDWTSAYGGGSSTMNINGTLTLTCGGGSGGYCAGTVGGGSVTINNSSQIIQTIASHTGYSGSNTIGWAYGHNSIGRTYSYYGNSNTGYGSGGSTAYISPTSGYCGAIKVTYKHN